MDITPSDFEDCLFRIYIHVLSLCRNKDKQLASQTVPPNMNAKTIGTNSKMYLEEYANIPRLQAPDNMSTVLEKSDHI